MDGKDGQEIPVTLICQEQKFECSRSKLAEASHYFKAMFYGQMKESRSTDAIPVHDVGADALEKLITFSKTKQFMATSENVMEMLEASTLFQFDKVQAACVNLIKANLSLGNCWDVMDTADYLGVKSLFKLAFHLALWEFESVRVRSEILDVKKEHLVSYLSENRLNTETEMNVFHCLRRWILHDELARREHLFDLLQVVRFGSLGFKDVDEMLEWKLIKDCGAGELVQGIGDLKREIKSSCNYSVLATNLLKIPRRKLSLVPFVTGHLFSDLMDSPAIPPDLAYYDTETKSFHQAAGLEHVTNGRASAVGFRVNVVGQEAYLTGGTYGLSSSDRILPIWSYNLLTHRWTFCGVLPRTCRLHGSCVLDHHLYVLGGVGNYRVMQSEVNRLDTKTGLWETLASLPEPLNSFATVVHKGLIFVLTVQVYCYEPEKQRWWTDRRGTLPNEYGIIDGVSHRNGIYFIGSNCSNLYLYYPECDEREHIMTYTIVGQFRNHSKNLCIVDDKIYSFSCGKCCKVEVYDIANDKFYVDYDKKDVLAPRHNFGCFAIPFYI